jgi:phosphoribosyl 1,2-cyclic phosphate phosphodiesterase
MERIMKLQYLGTAAYEGIPALFCSCSICQTCKTLGGKNIRKRTSMLLDDTILFDFSPDIMFIMHSYGLDLANLQHLFLTHTHSDHFNYYDLAAKLPYFSNTGNPVLNVYANDSCMQLIKTMQGDYPFDFDSVKNYILFHPVKALGPVTIGDYTITPLPARHFTNFKTEQTLNFLISSKGKNLFYAHDTAFPCDEVFAALKGIRLDVMSLDCTHGNLPTSSNTHMNLKDNLEIYRRFTENKTADEKTIRICSHFSHNGKIVHDTSAPEFLAEGFIMSYDGMVVEL